MQLAAVAPEEMSIAIAPAIRKLMKHHELAMADVDLWELHEAYAVTTLYNQAQLETPWEITNVNGGAVAARPSVRHVGHPLPRLDAARARAARRAAAPSSACARPAAWRPPRTSSADPLVRRRRQSLQDHARNDARRLGPDQRAAHLQQSPFGGVESHHQIGRLASRRVGRGVSRRRRR